MNQPWIYMYSPSQSPLPPPSPPRVPTLTTTIQHGFGSVGHSNQGRKRSKRNPDRKQIKHSLFADDMILYIENPKDSARKLLELINEYSKVARYKINMLKKNLE